MISSFLPFVRSEGFIILSIIGIYLLFKKDFRRIPLLLSGTVFLAILGAIISGNWLWVIDENPYIKFERTGVFNPGHGEWDHYLRSAKSTWTNVFLYLGVFTGLLYVWKWILDHRSDKNRIMAILCFGIFMTYLFVHGFIWYAGMMGSHGLNRVFMVTIPCLVLLNMAAINTLLSTRVISRAPFVIVLLIGIYAFRSSYRSINYSYPWDVDRVSINEGAATPNMRKAYQWIKDKGYDNRLIVHMLPEFNVIMDKNPYIDPTSPDSETNALLTCSSHLIIGLKLVSLTSL